MNFRWLRNSHQRHKFLRAEASRDIFLNFESQKWRFLGFLRGISTVHTMLFPHNTRKTGNNAITMSRVFHNIARLKHFTDLNLFKYAFNVIQNWGMDASQFYSKVLIFW